MFSYSQALGESMLTPLQENEFQALLNGGVAYKTGLIAFSITFLERFGKLMDSAYDAALLEHEVSSCVMSSLKRIETISRSLLHFFAFDEIPIGMSPLVDQDILYWKTLKATTFPEKSIQKIFCEKDSFWFKETMEVVEKGGTAVLLNEKQAELKSLMGDGVKDTDVLKLKGMSELYAEIQKSMRSQKLSTTRDRLVETHLKV